MQMQAGCMDDEPLDQFNLVGSQIDDESPATNHHVVQADADDLPAMGYLLLAAPAGGPDDEVLDTTTREVVDEMVRVATQCGEDDAGTVWSEGEHKVLLDRLNRYAKVLRCLKIACELPKKTALDVALRCRWFQDKENTAKQDELLQKDDSAGGKVKINGKGDKDAKNNKKMYPLSKEALDSKSTKELIRDSYMFLKRIEDNFKNEQLDNNGDCFCYVKTNMDAIEKRMHEIGISLTMPPIDEEGLKEIVASHPNSSAQK